MRTKDFSNRIRYLIIAAETTTFEALFFLHYRLAKLTGVKLHAIIHCGAIVKGKFVWKPLGLGSEK